MHVAIVVTCCVKYEPTAGTTICTTGCRTCVVYAWKIAHATDSSDYIEQSALEEVTEYNTVRSVLHA
eukprot:13035-Heterococcus_DN1.PRE.1